MRLLGHRFNFKTGTNRLKSIGRNSILGEFRAHTHKRLCLEVLGQRRLQRISSLIHLSFSAESDIKMLKVSRACIDVSNEIVDSRVDAYST
jgi:hypothetical protein